MRLFPPPVLSTTIIFPPQDFLRRIVWMVCCCFGRSRRVLNTRSEPLFKCSDSDSSEATLPADSSSKLPSCSSLTSSNLSNSLGSSASSIARSRCAYFDMTAAWRRMIPASHMGRWSMTPRTPRYSWYHGKMRAGGSASKMNGSSSS